MRRVQLDGQVDCAGECGVTSRLRQPRARCRAPRGPAQPRRVMSCGDGSALILWAAQAHATTFSQPLAALLPAPRAWDLDAPERAFVTEQLRTWPYPGTWGRRRPTVTYPGRPNVQPPPMVQRGVALPPGATLADAVAELPRRGMVGGWRKGEKGRAA